MKSHVCIELYRLGKAIFTFGIAFYFAYLFALLPLEFKAKEKFDSSSIEVAYYAEGKKGFDPYKLLVANGKLETARNEKIQIDKLVAAITQVRKAAFVIAILFWIASGCLWLFYSDKSEEQKNDVNNPSIEAILSKFVIGGLSLGFILSITIYGLPFLYRAVGLYK